MSIAVSAPLLTSRQRKALRGRAHALQPIVIVGQAGVDDRVLRSVDEALTTHELIKVRLHEPEDKRADARRWRPAPARRSAGSSATR